MNRRNRLSEVAAGLILCLVLMMAEEITVQAAEKEEYDFLSSGIAEVLDPGALTNEAPVAEQTEPDINEKFENDEVDSLNCEHIFMPIDSTKETFAC